MENMPNDAGKSHHYPLYRKMTLIHWGQNIPHKKHPTCIEEGVHNISHDSTKNYMGFHVA
jgi:hypothetical protein